MCGIVGIVGSAPVAERLVEGLKRLEYRGYDSAGVATLVNGHIQRRRAEGRIDNLRARLDAEPLDGVVGIGHTRWATHGRPTEANAHPHATDRVALVHNGIIENFRDLRTELEGEGCVFETQTDTEVVAHLITLNLNRQMAPRAAVQAALDRLDGAFALAIVITGEHERMFGARRGSPLAVGYGPDEMYLGSDALALAPLTDRICYLEEGDWVELGRTDAVIFDRTGAEVQRPVVQTAASGALIGKGGFRHFMLKEIHEQPAVIGDTLHAVIAPESRMVVLPDLPFDFATVPRITLIGCGTAYYAGMIARYWFEQVARLPVDCDIASEFRYREGPMAPGGVAVFVSQSGETADTLAALRYCRSQGQHIVSVVNVPQSTIARESDVVLPTIAGPEIGVASTKAFTAQLTMLAVMAMLAARRRGHLPSAREQALVDALTRLPATVSEVLSHDQAIRDMAHIVAEARDVLFIGRGVNYPLALEAALKLKEISYIHAEGYAAGEMKHGPIALIDEAVPIVVLAPRDAWYDKTVSNVQEAMARGGRVLALSDAAGLSGIGDGATATIELPASDVFTAPLLYAIPAQLLAYYTAVLKGTDVDMPRNLAKSVTVE